MDILIALLSAALGSTITVLVDRYLRNADKSSRVTAPFSIIRLDDVRSWGWDGPTLLKHLIKLDHETIPGLNETREGNVEQWAPVFTDHPSTWAVISNKREEILGYWHFVPLAAGAFQLAKDGQLLDSKISNIVIEDISSPGIYNLYFVTFTIKSDYQVRGFRLLADSFFRELETLAEQGVFFKEICANAYTVKGVRLCQTFGMQKVRPHQDFGTIYTSSLFPLPELSYFHRYPRLKNLYNRKLAEVSA